MKKIVLIGILLLFGCRLFSQSQGSGFGFFDPANAKDELTPQQYAEIKMLLEQSKIKLSKEGKLPPPNAESVVKFGWPLKLKNDISDPGYYGISNFVDHDPAAGSLQDYNCGTRTYDITGYNHKGTDIFTWPFGWYKMDLDQVKIVAAAAGTIVYKSDGGYDRNCSMNNNPWNAVYVQHSDGSVAWYGHMKNGSTISKAVGESVAKGEYLGIVGSSGSSTGPHLHFEVYDAGNQLVDPWEGTCNLWNPDSWWKNQKPYYESALNKLSTNSAAPVFPSCPHQEIPNESDAFCAGQLIYFLSYYHDQQAGQTISGVVKKPDGSTQWTFTIDPPTYYAASYWYYYFTLPGNAPAGTWTYQITFLGNTYLHNFQVYSPTTTISVTPSSDVCPGQTATLTSSSATGNVWSNGATTQAIQVSAGGSYTVTATNACGVTSASADITEIGCSQPTNQTNTNITASSAKLNWATKICGIGYQVKYREAGSSAWLTKSVSGNVGTTTITGLLPSTSYEWKVRTKCATNPLVWSSFTPVKTFTTDPLKVAETQPGGNSDFIMYPNPATDELHIRLFSECNYAISILNVIGQKVFDSANMKSDGTNENEIEIEQLPPGAYWVHLTSDNQKFVQKLVKE